MERKIGDIIPGKVTDEGKAHFCSKHAEEFSPNYLPIEIVSEEDCDRCKYEDKLFADRS